MLPYGKVIIRKMCDHEERLAEDMMKEGGGRRDERPALRRIQAG